MLLDDALTLPRPEVSEAQGEALIGSALAAHCPHEAVEVRGADYDQSGLALKL